jgi:hypothetical protein
MASPKDTADHVADHLDDYYLPPDECYDSLDDDEMCAERERTPLRAFKV